MQNWGLVLIIEGMPTTRESKIYNTNCICINCFNADGKKIWIRLHWRNWDLEIVADSNSNSLFVHYIEQLMFVRIVILLDWIVLICLTVKGKNIRKIFGTDMFGAGNLRYQTSVGNRIRATSQQGTYLASARWPSFSCGVATEAAATARPCVLAAPHHPCPGMWAPGRCSTLYRPH